MSPLILHGVPVYPRPGAPAVEAVGMLDGRIVANGPLDTVRAALPPEADLRRLSGGALLPAFTDPHQHACLVASDPYADALHRRASDIRGLVDVIAALVAAEPARAPGETAWLRYHGYEPLFLAEHRSPTAAELDRASPDRPLHVLTRTFHESVVNTAGLDALGIGRTTRDPEGGRIIRDRRGRPTGLLLEVSSFTAEAASRRRDAADPGAWRERLLAHGKRLLAHGIVRIGDAAVPVATAAALTATLGEIGVEATSLLIGARIDEPALIAGQTAKVLLDGGEYCHLCMTGRQLAALLGGSFKANMGPEKDLARAVGMRAGFPVRESDRRWHTGVRFPHEAGFGDLFRRAAAIGSGLAVHAVGNGSVEALLNARDADPGLAAAVPIRVEHAMTLDPTLTARLARSGLAVVVQPGFLRTQGHELTIAPLPDPLRLMPFRRMVEAGVTMAFSTDYPATELSPWTAIAAAVTRQDRTGAVIAPKETMSLAAALEASTTSAARVLGVHDAGTLEPGMRADVVLCDRDPFTAPPGSLESLVTLATWSSGRLVFERGAG